MFIEIVCRFYEEHYQPSLPIPTHFLGDLMRLILTENSFKFNDKHYLQTHGIVRDCAIIIRRGGPKTRGWGALHKNAAKIGCDVIFNITEGGYCLSFC